MNKLETACHLAEQIAADNSVGYQWGGWGLSSGGYDCGHLIIDVFERAGYGVKAAGATYTGNMRPVFLRCGFSDVTAGVDLKTGSGLHRGDVLLNQKSHAALCLGFGKIVQASSNYDGRPGDSSGREIAVRNYYNFPWDCVLRPSASAGSSQAGGSTPSAGNASTQPVVAGTGEYIVKAGDTLYGIAGKLGILWTDLAAWNGIKSPYVIHPGQILMVKKPAAATPAKPAAQYHTVLAGDTLWSVAARTLGSGSKWKLIAEENGIKFPWIIRPGMILKIPRK